MQVLIVEDDCALRYTFSFALEQQGHSITQAATLQDAAHALWHLKPQVAVLDLMLGKQHSLDFASELAIRSPGIEIVYVTGSGMFPNAEFYQMQLPIAAVLRKPVDLVQLIEVVSHIARNPSVVSVDDRAPSAFVAA